MIAVIADDFTGAAEVGGIGLRHGLKVVIKVEKIQSTDADLLIIATDTRSLAAPEAASEMSRITKLVESLNPKFVYKKVDSVLRGNVVEELQAQMKVTGKNRTIVIAANPHFKRIINKGRYFIDDVPLNNTAFANDPEYPVKSELVQNIVRDNTIHTCHNPVDKLPDNGIIIGDVNCSKDLIDWVGCIDSNTFSAGASGFFDTIIDEKGMYSDRFQQSTPPFGERALFILGSTFPKDFDLMKRIEENGHYLSNMPPEIYLNKEFHPAELDKWVLDIAKGLDIMKKVVVSINYPISDEPNITRRIKNNLGELVKRVMEKVALDELIVEGGATTSMILHYLNVTSLTPLQELDTGVIRMKMDGIDDVYLTTKPGSYLWPDNIWNLRMKTQDIA